MSSATNSFLDELLSRLVLELGTEQFERRVRLIGMSELVAGMARSVMHQRLGWVPDSLGNHGGTSGR